jgi:hypothetical protein
MGVNLLTFPTIETSFGHDIAVVIAIALAVDAAAVLVSRLLLMQ